MSGQTALGTEATIFVRLLDEGTDVWRPVLARAVGGGLFQIADQSPPDDEAWEFQPGEWVSVETKTLSDGECMVAVRASSGTLSSRPAEVANKTLRRRR